jgi:hypothetical protein
MDKDFFASKSLNRLISFFLFEGDLFFAQKLGFYFIFHG